MSTSVLPVWTILELVALLDGPRSQSTHSIKHFWAGDPKVRYVSTLQRDALEIPKFAANYTNHDIGLHSGSSKQKVGFMKYMPRRNINPIEFDAIFSLRHSHLLKYHFHGYLAIPRSLAENPEDPVGGSPPEDRHPISLQRYPQALRYFICMEYAPCGDLVDWFKKNRHIPVATVQRLFRQIVSAVSYLHNSGYVHRDLKLENIVIMNLSPIRVKLADFNYLAQYRAVGIFDPSVRNFGVETPGSDRTADVEERVFRGRTGTLDYMAPEIFTREGYTGPPTDIWTLGIILYTLLTHSYPFAGSTDEKIINRIISNRPSAMSSIPDGVYDLVKGLLTKRPEQRLTMAAILAHPFVSFEPAGSETP